jgi:dTDP-4-amino-4,6-dideoxygalactose transaminase
LSWPRIESSVPAKAAFDIPFGRSTIVGNELAYIAEALRGGKIGGGGRFMKFCEAWLERRMPAHRVLVTHSCTAALEMAAMLLNAGPGDEIIMPSFTFSSTATAFVLRGATPVFVDIRPDTLNIDETQIEAAISPRTKAVVPVHYAGVACEMDSILAVAADRGLAVVEDAAQAHLSYYKGRALGTIGDLGCLSFHETKNVISGEGGALILNDERFVERSEIIREKGTNRGQFFRAQVDKYNWQDIGSSYTPGEIVCAFLLAQLEHADAICARRRALHDLYRRRLQPLAALGEITVSTVSGDETNGHIFWLLLENEATRASLIKHLAADGISAVFHYIPLHSSPAGRRFGRAVGSLPITNSVSRRLLRLPLYLELSEDDVARITDSIVTFFGGKT